MLQNHCVSLETAKRMKELGWVKETMCMFCLMPSLNGSDDNEEDQVYFLRGDPKRSGLSRNDFYSPLASEIMEELPRSVKVEKNKYTFSMGKNSIEYCVGYHRRDSNKDMHYRFTCHCANIAEALALLWCTLREQGII